MPRRSPVHITAVAHALMNSLEFWSAAVEAGETFEEVSNAYSNLSFARQAMAEYLEALEADASAMGSISTHEARVQVKYL